MAAAGSIGPAKRFSFLSLSRNRVFYGFLFCRFSLFSGVFIFFFLFYFSIFLFLFLSVFVFSFSILYVHEQFLKFVNILKIRYILWNLVFKIPEYFMNSKHLLNFKNISQIDEHLFESGTHFSPCIFLKYRFFNTVTIFQVHDFSLKFRNVLKFISIF